MTSTTADGRALRFPIVQAGAVDRSAELPSWPVDLLLWGFPLWWVLGMMPFIFVIVALVMLGLLVSHGLGTLAVPPGVVPYVAFVVWMLPCALALDTSDRVFGFAQRATTDAAMAVVLLYVVNASERISVERILGGIAAVWGFVVIGGYLGMLFPDVRISTPVAKLLPAGLTANPLVRDLVSPPLAEVQTPYGAPAAFVRPSAPFAYANQWGGAVALLTPIVIALLCRTRVRSVRAVLIAGLFALVVPAIASLNRGMFLGLAVGVVYVAVRQFFRGRLLGMLSIVVLGVAVALGFALAGVGGAIESRQTYSNTTAGRLSIYDETYRAALESPLVGYGAPRPSTETSISLGTQGYMWQVMFSFGFIGLALFALFLLGAVWRTRAARGAGELWMHATLVVACVTIIFYGLDSMQKLSVVLVAAVMLRRRVSMPARQRSP